MRARVRLGLGGREGGSLNCGFRAGGVARAGARGVEVARVAAEVAVLGSGSESQLGSGLGLKVKL